MIIILIITIIMIIVKTILVVTVTALVILAISIYTLDDVDISRNLIDSPYLANGQCPPPGRCKTMAGVNSHFVVVTEEEIFQMQDNAIPNSTKKATKLGMKVFRGKKVFTYNLLTCLPHHSLSQS